MSKPPAMELVSSMRGYKTERTKVTREILRRRINGERHIDALLGCAEALHSGRSIEINPETGQLVGPPPLDSAAVSAIKAEADIHLKLLNKVLPDLKAIELKDTIGEPKIDGRLMSDTELVHRLKHLGMAELDAIEEADEQCVDNDTTTDVPSLF